MPYTAGIDALRILWAKSDRPIVLSSSSLNAGSEEEARGAVEARWKARWQLQ